MIWNYSNLNLWIVIFGVVQIVTAFYGIKFIKILNIFSSPCLLIMGFILIYFMRTGSNTTLGQVLIDEGQRHRLPGRRDHGLHRRLRHSGLQHPRHREGLRCA